LEKVYEKEVLAKLSVKEKGEEGLKGRQ